MSAIVVPTAAVEADTQVRGFDIEVAMDPREGVPNPPQCILERLKKEDKVWRWLSAIAVRRNGKREYTVYSPDAREKKLIDDGVGTPPGVFVDVENKVCWRDDAFLGVIPRKRYEQREAFKRQRTLEQTKRSLSRDALQDAAQRSGSKLVRHTIEEWQSNQE